MTRTDRQVFDLFARLSPRRLQAATIVQAVSAIECRLLDGRTTSFELMTLDSESPPKRINSFHTTGYAWQRAIGELTRQCQELLLEMYADATIMIEFFDRPPMRARINRLRNIVRSLLGQPPGFEGPLQLSGDIVRVSRRVFGAERGNWRPIGIDHSRATPIVWSRIRDKVEPLRNRVAGQLELVAYSFRDTLRRQGGVDAAVPRADIRDWLRGSAFCGVWIVEWHLKCVCDWIERPAA